MDSDCDEALPFENRAAAGAALARRLFGVHWHAPAIVLALPRGGVPVAQAVAGALDLPMDVLVVRKVGHPEQRELAIGAVAAGGISVRNDDQDASISREQFETLASRILRMECMSALYSGDRTVGGVRNHIPVCLELRFAAARKGTRALTYYQPYASLL